MGRLLTQQQTINSGQPELIVSNHYDELGQLEGKNVGGDPAGSGLQSIDYSYNIRGWLKGINDIANNNALFSFAIGYNEPTIAGAIPLYNGNISETQWKTAMAIS